MTALRLLAALFVAAMLAGPALAQAPATQTCPANQAICAVQNFQYLNRVIVGDTTATGQRQRADRVYQLGRGNLYLMDASVRNTGYHLRIVGAPGTGPLPQIYTTVNATSGNRVGDVFLMVNDITMRDFAFSGVIQDPVLNPQGNAVMSNTIVRVVQAGFTLRVDGVVWVNTVAQHVRTDSALRALFLTNSTWASSGWLGSGGTNFGAGKGIDLRTGSIDSLVIRNNTFINYTDRIIRHRASTGPINNMIFDHNTIINAVSYHGTLALGAVGRSIKITNNLFLDSFVAGADTSDVTRMEEFDEHGEFYPNGRPKMTWVISEPNQTTQWTVSNNVYSVTAPVRAFYQQFGNGVGDNDIIGPGDPLTTHQLGRIPNPQTAFVEMSVNVTNRPAAPISMVTWYRTPQAQGGAGRTKQTQNFNGALHDFDRRDLDYYVGTLNASYPTSSPAYTASAGGCPVGDLRWFPGVNAAQCFATSAEGAPEAAALGLANAPNPFRDGTMIRYALAEAAEVTLTVYDALGREVARLADAAPQAAGEHSVRWSTAGAAPGVYVVRLRAGDAVGTHRLLVVR